MKIGIVTQPLTGNFGGLLQNYALQSILIHLGHQPMTIDYVNHLPTKKYLRLYAKALFHLFTPRHHKKFPRRYQRRRSHNTKSFIRHHIATTKTIYPYSQSIASRHNFKIVITGSDQVWRPLYNPEIADMYLDFIKDANIRKIAYAASFGTDNQEYTPEEIQLCSPAAHQLDAVSVRENSGIELCRTYFNIDAIETLDPTLLLTDADYQQLTNKIPRSSEKFVGAYILDNNETYNHVIDKTMQLLGISSRRIVTDNDKNVSPEKWIAMFRDADYIITDSFHGTVFSIIFQKPFITFCNKSRGAARFTSLLGNLNLMNRLVESENDVTESLILEQIDWNNVNAELASRRNYSIDFLKRNLQ